MTRQLLLALLVGLSMIPAVANASILGFGDFSQFTINQSDGNSSPALFPAPGIASKIQLTNFAFPESRSIFANTLQPISKFTASFTYQNLEFRDGLNDSFGGVSFVLQNSPQGTSAVGGGSTYGGGIPNSVEVTFQLGSSSSSGLFTNGNINGGAAGTAPVDFLTGHPIDVTLVYNGATLIETITDATTLATFNHLYSINIPTVLGSSTAFVGFGAGNFSSMNQQSISNFQFSAVPEPSTIALLAMAIPGLLAYSRRRRRKATETRTL